MPVSHKSVPPCDYFAQSRILIEWGECQYLSGVLSITMLENSLLHWDVALRGPTSLSTSLNQKCPTISFRLIFPPSYPFEPPAARWVLPENVVPLMPAQLETLQPHLWRPGYSAKDVITEAVAIVRSNGFFGLCGSGSNCHVQPSSSLTSSHSGRLCDAAYSSTFREGKYCDDDIPRGTELEELTCSSPHPKRRKAFHNSVDPSLDFGNSNNNVQ
eukprot:PhF_6_TR4734/c0_g1_i1/m.6551